jgi:glucans biosynthesis protein
MHGAGGGAPKGNRNPWKHGGFTAEGLALKKQISALARMARETIRALEGDEGTVRDVRCDAHNSEFGALFRFPSNCPPMPRDDAR